MSLSAIKRLILFAIIVIGFGIHVFLHNNLFSFFVFPAGIATILPYTMPLAILPIILLIGSGELLTTLPLGVMTAVAISPFLLRRVFPNVMVGISWTFFSLILFTVTTQMVIIEAAVLYSLKLPLVLPTVWQYIPFWPLLLSIGFTTVVTWSITVLWDEMGLNRALVRTGKL